ncbi:MAG TPA: hypothetical protein DCF63_04075, partial [Planctomycetaceae bacterium]|nr:hypothetical protein [Planctomycetaceae bacterium]
QKAASEIRRFKCVFLESLLVFRLWGYRISLFDDRATINDFISTHHAVILLKDVGQKRNHEAN